MLAVRICALAYKREGDRTSSLRDAEQKSMRGEFRGLFRVEMPVRANATVENHAFLLSIFQLSKLSDPGR